MPDRLGKASYSRQLFRRLARRASGCVALIDAAVRELHDHGRRARYEHESDGEHLLDALFEDEDDDECETTVVYYGR